MNWARKLVAGKKNHEYDDKGNFIDMKYIT